MEEHVSYGGEETEDGRYRALREGTGHGSRISCERVYIEAMGDDLYGGLFVSQLVFWSGKAKRDGWFYRSYEEWMREDYLNEYQVRKLAKECVVYGWLETKVMKAKGAPTVHYRIRQREFMAWLDSKTTIPILRNDRIESAKSQDETCENAGTIESAKSQELYIHTPIHTPPQTKEKIAVAQQPPAAKPRRKKDSHPNTKPILDAYLTVLGHRSVHFGKEGSGAAALARAGWSPEQVVACYEWLKRDHFWKEKHLGLQSVYSQIGGWNAKHGECVREDDAAEIERIRQLFREQDAAGVGNGLSLPDLQGREVDTPHGQQGQSGDNGGFQHAHGQVRLPVQRGPASFVGAVGADRRAGSWR